MDMSALCVAFWDRMTAHYGTNIVDKKSDLVMQSMGWFLERMGIQDKETFLNRFTTTIGHDIYVPFEIGAGSDDELWRQMVVCVHEHQHVEQVNREGFLLFTARYLSDSAQRANYEAEAYSCNIEMNFLRSGLVRSPKFYASRLEAYGCTPTDIQFALAGLTVVANIVNGGGISRDATKVARDILAELSPGFLKF